MQKLFLLSKVLTKPYLTEKNCEITHNIIAFKKANFLNWLLLTWILNYKYLIFSLIYFSQRKIHKLVKSLIFTIFCKIRTITLLGIKNDEIELKLNSNES